VQDFIKTPFHFRIKPTRFTNPSHNILFLVGTACSVDDGMPNVANAQNAEQV